MSFNDPRSSNISASHSTASGGTPAREAIICPFCGTADSEPMALFGPQLSTAQYYCRTCHTPFQRIKHEDTRAH